MTDLDGIDAALRALAAGNTADAEAMARFVVSKEPQDALRLCVWVRCLYSLGRGSEALAPLDTFSRLYPDNPGVNEVHGWLALLVLEAAPSDGAVAARVRELAIHDDAPAPVQVAVGHLALAAGRAAEARDAYREALRTLADDGPVWRALARAAQAVGDVDEEEEALQEVMRLAPRDEAACVRHLQLARARLAPEALVSMAADALERLPQSAGVAELLADARRELLARDPTAAALGRFRAALDRLDRANADHWLRTMQAQHGADPRVEFLALEMEVAFTPHEPVRVMRDLMDLCRKYPTAWEPHAMLGQLLIQNGPALNVRLALTHAERAWTLSGQQMRAGYRYYRALARLGRAAQAAEMRRRLIMGPDPDVAALASLEEPPRGFPEPPVTGS